MAGVYYDPNLDKTTFEGDVSIEGDITVLGDGLEAKVQERRTVTGPEETAGFLVVSLTPTNAGTVEVRPEGGPNQTNQSVSPGGGDFVMLNTSELHFNNNGSASGLSGHIAAGDTILIIYEV